MGLEPTALDPQPDCRYRAMTDNDECGQPDPDQIVQALDQTGFLLEQRVYQLFENNGLEAQINVPFSDPDTGKSREIDVVGSEGNFAKSTERIADPWVWREIIAECKNTTNPFVVVGRRTNDTSNHCKNWYSPGFDPLKLGWRGVYGTANVLGFQGLKSGPFQDGFKGNQLVRLNRHSGKWKADNQGVFDSIFYPLVKATTAHMADDNEEPDDETPTFSFFFPILVTSGAVYRVEVGTESPSVERVGWVPLVRAFKENKLSGEFLIEVVELAHLESYIRTRVDRTIHEVSAKLAERGELFNPSWLVEQYGQPRHLDIFKRWVAHYQQALLRKT